MSIVKSSVQVDLLARDGTHMRDWSVDYSMDI